MSATSNTELQLSLPPGTSLGVSISDVNSNCVVVSKRIESSPLQVGDAIISLNGIDLCEVEGGMSSWKEIFSNSAKETRNLVVNRPSNPAAEIQDVEFERAHAHIEDKELLKYLETMTSLPIEPVLESVSCGDDLTMRAVNALETREELAYRTKLVEGGLIQIILDILKQCGEKEFSQVLVATTTVVSPVEYIGCLSQYVIRDVMSGKRTPQDNIDDPVCIEIAENIGPLVECMCDNETREFFKSKFFWYQSYSFFVMFVQNLVMMNSEAMNVLLQYEDGRLTCILIQTLFFEKYRPDIMKDELAPKLMLGGPTCHAALEIIQMHMSMITNEKGVGDRFIGEQSKKIYDIGVTPVVCGSHDPNCSISFMRGLVDLLGDPAEATTKHICYYLLHLFSAAGCIGSDVIEGVIGLGMHVSDKVDADHLPSVMYRLLHGQSNMADRDPVPDDSRYAVAIKSGFFEMALKLLVSCKTLGSEDGLQDLANVVRGATIASTFPKSSEQITENLRNDLANSIATTEVSSAIQGNDKAMKIYDMIYFFVDDEMKQKCHNCRKVLEINTIKRCSRCKDATYCSKDCQSAHWKRGHKRSCVMFERIVGVPDNQKDVATNQALDISKIAEEIHKRDGFKLLVWSVVEGIDIHDTAMVIDFKNAPPSSQFVQISKFVDSGEGKHFTEDAIEEMKRYQERGDLVIIVLAVHPSGAKRTLVLRSFPKENTPHGCWSTTQGMMRIAMTRLGWRPGKPFDSNAFM